MNKQFSCPIEIKEIGENGEFEGYASVFGNVDSYGHRVRKGAFAATLRAWEAKGKMPPILWSHDRSEPIGRAVSLTEDEHGLLLRGQLMVKTIQKASEARSLIQDEVADGLSIGFIRKDSERLPDGTIELKEVDLIEVSVVLSPSNSETRVHSIKQSGTMLSLKEFETFLRDAGGFSKSEATAVASHGYRQLLSDSAKEVEEKQQLIEAINILKGNKNA